MKYSKEGLKNFTEFFNNTQVPVFHPIYSMLYTVNLGLCDYVPFSQIQSHISKHLTIHYVFMHSGMVAVLTKITPSFKSAP